MGGAERRARSLPWPAVLVWAGCTATGYSACPVDVPGGLPPHAFAACRTVLAARFGTLVVDDAAAFRLQTDWAPCEDLPGERRASVFRDGDAGGLGVVVEVRWLREPLLGLPRWTEPRGDAEAERELADRLLAALSP